MSLNPGQIFNCETPQVDGLVPREGDRAGSMSYLVRAVSRSDTFYFSDHE